MDFFDRKTSQDRIDECIKPVVEGLLKNKQLFDEETEDRPYVTKSVKYRSEEQDRRSSSEYTGEDEFVNNILEIFDFDTPLDFQVNSWKSIEELNNRKENKDESQAAIIEAPTGFGKTEAFLGPLYQLLREGRQDSTVIVYPRRALLQNQLQRILHHIRGMNDSGDNISVGVYMGKMPYKRDSVEDNNVCFEGGRFKLANCWCGDDDNINSFRFHGSSREYRIRCEENEEHEFSDRELVLSQKEIIDGQNPDIILTTLESLELFSIKPNYDIIHQVDSVILDEAHLYTGLRGAHSANIIENINEITDDPILWVGSSATIDNAAKFGNELFGFSGDDLETIRPDRESDFETGHGDEKHYYFMISDEDGPGSSSMMIQQLMMAGHTLLEDASSDDRGKILSFIDSISQVNQKTSQLQDAESNRRLWEYHRSGDGYENWEEVAGDMGFDFLDEDLELEPVYSDSGFDAERIAESDLLLSTSFLEVGIDVGDINIVCQYQTPQNLSSFTQRIGRAAREEGTDAHIFVFLSDMTGDANMFYRAERFLDSDIRTPLKTDNKVVEWIHDATEEFYNVTRDIYRGHVASNREMELRFFQEYIKEGLGYGSFHNFLSEPGDYLEDTFGRGGDINQPMVTEETLEKVEAVLETEKEETDSELQDIDEYIEVGEDSVITSDNASKEYLEELKEDILGLIMEFAEKLDECELALDGGTERTEEMGENLSGLRQRTVDVGVEDIEECESILNDLTREAAELMSIRVEANKNTDEEITRVSVGQVDELKEGAQALAEMASDERLENLTEKEREVYYLQQCLRELEEYRGLDQDEPARRPFLSLWYVKKLLRAAYYFDKHLQVDGDGFRAEEIWYVPPDYFESTGRYITVFKGEYDKSGSEESIDSIVGSYTPYRSEYQGDNTMRLFMPKTEVVEPSDEDSMSEVEFDFSNINTDDRPEVRIPESITLTEVEDISNDASNIVGYCPECLQIIPNGDLCPKHERKDYGKIHSNPQVRTSQRDKNIEKKSGGLSLMEVTADVILEGVTLDITPAEYMGDIGYVWADQSGIQREIDSPEPLGFSVDTRGVELDIEPLLESLDRDVRDKISRYKELDDIEMRELVHHTAAHLLLEVVSDISGVNESMLFYGMEEEEGKVFVFERTEGGQGLVDLFYSELYSDPGNVLESINRISYNPQVENERLWAKEEVVEELPDDGMLKEEKASEIVREYTEIQFENVRDKVVQEFISTADGAVQLKDSMENGSLQTAYMVKHKIAAAQIEGGDFPEDELESLKIDLQELEDSIRSLFLSPDIDGCVENLHIRGCISGHDQKDSLSYVVLEELRNHFTKKVSEEESKEEIFGSEKLPAAKIDGKNIFLTF